MKNLKILLGFILISSYSLAQPPTGNPPSPSTIPNNANSAWYRGGNFPGGIAGTNNIFGTMWPSPIYIKTNSVIRGIFTTGNTFGSGDGLRLTSPGTCPNYLDMWADDAGCETTVKFHVNGRVEGANSQLRVVGDLNGLNLNASGNRIFFSRGLGFVETGRVGYF